MSEFFDLTLDTEAPVVSFGAVSGPVAGSMLAVAYTVDEVATLVATLTLADNRQLVMGDTGTQFRYVLPLDAPTGNVTVEVEAEDDLGNFATYSTTFPITGAVGIEIVPTAAQSREAGIVPTADPATVRAIRRSSPWEVRSRRRVAASRPRRVEVEHRTTRIANAEARNVRTFHSSTARVISSSRVVISTAQPETEIAILRQVDGPRTEEALVVLGLL